MTDFLTRQQVADQLQVSYYTVLRWTREGLLPCRKIGRTIRYDRRHVEAIGTQGLIAQKGARDA